MIDYDNSRSYNPKNMEEYIESMCREIEIDCFIEDVINDKEDDFTAGVLK